MVAVALVALVALPALWLAPGAHAGLLPAADVTPVCTDPTAALRATCVLSGSQAALIRQFCDYEWVDGICDQYAPAPPQYETHTDPSPGARFTLLVGAEHNHSGYSDGYPDSIPADFYRAGRTGHNIGDSGGDTGVMLDFMFGSDHSDNEKLPITTAATCVDPASIPSALQALDVMGAMPPLACNHVAESNDQYWKWAATLRQAIEATDFSPANGYTGFTAIRGFEYTNDYYNHMGVFFSRNVVNVKTDGSYVSLDAMWNWLREPVTRGGGADALVVFNHPGGDPHLSPFDDGLPTGPLLQATKGGSNWNDLAYVPDVDQRVAGIEVNGGDDIEWYVKALTNGWHVGPVANEDEHEREWSSTVDGKTLILSRGRGPRDYYFALENQRTVAIQRDLVHGTPGTKASVPSILFYADGRNIQDPRASVLGSTINSGKDHTLHVEMKGLPAGSRIALVSNTTGGQSAPIQLGAADSLGNFTASHPVMRPASGQQWYFAVVCPAAAGTNCGTDQQYNAVTAPIWLAA